MTVIENIRSVKYTESGHLLVLTEQYKEVGFSKETLDTLREALVPHVYVVHYTHKHGADISVYNTLEKAQASCKDLMAHRMSETWDRHDVEHMEALPSFDEQLSHFIDVEAGISYGETIEILER